jgi:hypothetical protein
MASLVTTTVAGTASITATTNDGSTAPLTVTQAGTARAAYVTRNVASATRAMADFAQLHSGGGAHPALHIQQTTTASDALRITSDGATAKFAVTGTGALTGTAATFTGTLDVGSIATFSGAYIKIKDDASTLTGYVGSGTSVGPSSGTGSGAADLCYVSKGSLALITNDAAETPRLTITAAGAAEFTGTLAGTSATFSGNLTVNGSQLYFYKAVPSGNPEFHIGSSATNQLVVQSVYTGFAQTLNYVSFKTFSSLTSANAGQMIFYVDEGAASLSIHDAGITSGTGNFSGALTGTTGEFSGTGSFGSAMSLTKNSGLAPLTLLSNPANQVADIGGEIIFQATYRATSDTTPVARIKGSRENATTNNWAGKLTFHTSPGGDSPSASTEQMRIQSDGNVGIGTTSPDTNLQIVDPTINSKDILHLKTSADSVGDYLGIRFTSGVGGAGPHAAIRTYGGPSSGDSYISLLTTTDGGTLVQGLTQDKNGSVGIGTTAPGVKLEIGGMASPAMQLTSSSDANYNVKISANYSWGNPANITGVNGANIVSLHNGYDVKVGGSGKVGIGTTAPKGTLQIGSGIGGGNVPTGRELVFGANNSEILFLSDNSSVSLDGSIGSWNTVYNVQTTKIEFYKPAANVGQMRFHTNAGAGLIQRMVISHTGNVGIGITDPGSFKLNVNGAVYSSGSIIIANNAPYFGALSSAGAYVPLVYFNSSNEMTLGGGTLATNAYPIRNIAKYMTFEPAGGLGAAVETMRITNGSFAGVGSVGIGTNAPSAMLHVHGGGITISNDQILSVGTTSGNSGKVRLFGDSGTAYYVDWFGITSDRQFKFQGSASASPYITYFTNAGTGKHRIYANGYIRTSEYFYLNAAATPTTSSYEGKLYAYNNTGAMLYYKDGYNTAHALHSASDYRLKENVTNYSGSDACALIKGVNARRFDFISDTVPADQQNDRVGFLAHELQDAGCDFGGVVSGTKDEMMNDSEGNPVPKMQSVDYKALVPVLWSALQDALKRIETLENNH